MGWHLWTRNAGTLKLLWNLLFIPPLHLVWILASVKLDLNMRYIICLWFWLSTMLISWKNKSCVSKTDLSTFRKYLKCVMISMLSPVFTIIETNSFCNVFLLFSCGFNQYLVFCWLRLCCWITLMNRSRVNLFPLFRNFLRVSDHSLKWKFAANCCRLPQTD